MADGHPHRSNCNDTVEALDAADRLISRLQDRVAEQLPPDSNIGPEDAFHEIVGELEAAEEIDEVRSALGRDPNRFGSPARRDR